MSGSRISVVIPAFNSEEMLPACLEGVFRSEYRDFEVIVVDDASHDGTAGRAAAFPCKVIRLAVNGGAAAARNAGARAATGDILVFIDTDILVAPDTLGRIAENLRECSVSAVVGVYSARHRNTDVVSQYKNLWIRYTYLVSPSRISWVFTSITGIRRAAFEHAGGFNPDYSAATGIDDLSFGMTLSDLGLGIALDPQLEVEHCKTFTLAGFVRNQFVRSRWFTAYVLRTHRLRRVVRQKRFANVTAQFVYAIPLAYLALASALCALCWPQCWHPLAVAAVLYGAANLPFLRFFRRHHSRRMTLKAIGISFLDHLICVAGVAAGIMTPCPPQLAPYSEQQRPLDLTEQIRRKLGT